MQHSSQTGRYFSNILSHVEDARAEPERSVPAINLWRMPWGGNNLKAQVSVIDPETVSKQASEMSWAFLLCCKAEFYFWKNILKAVIALSNNLNTLLTSRLNPVQYGHFIFDLHCAFYAYLQLHPVAHIILQRTVWNTFCFHIEQKPILTKCGVLHQILKWCNSVYSLE